MSCNASLFELQKKKKNGEKIVAFVVWDYQMARIVDRVGVDIVSVGDTIGHNLWGQGNPLEITVDEMLIVTKAVRRGTSHALLSCDFPYGPLQEGTDSAVRTAIRFAKEAGVDMIKLDGAADFPETVSVLTRAGIPVWAQIGITPQTALRHGVDYQSMTSGEIQAGDSMLESLVADARAMEAAGAAMIDFTNSGPVVGPAVAAAVSIPVIGGLGGGPWLDGRVRSVNAAIGYGERFVESASDTYANVAQAAYDGLSALRDDIRAGRQIRGAAKLKKTRSG